MLSLFLISTNIATQQGAALCNAAKVLHAKKAVVEVHETFSPDSRVIGRLSDNTTVYTCDETDLFYKVLYAAPGAACSAGTSNGLPEDKTSDCRSGWIPKKYVEVLSG